MSTEIATTDPRPYYARALAWAAALVAATDPTTFGDATPCAEYDVRALLGHLVATVDRARTIAEGGDPRTMPVVVADVPDDGWAAAFTAAVEKMTPTWADDALLDREVIVPWGTVPGRAALWGYINEALVHGWDLAVATGQDAEADADLAEATFAGVRPKIPAEFRGGPMPFGEVVPSAAAAGPTERLANWSGHGRS